MTKYNEGDLFWVEDLWLRDLDGTYLVYLAQINGKFLTRVEDSGKLCGHHIIAVPDINRLNYFKILGPVEYD
jgi:hypothetical protein